MGNNEIDGAVSFIKEWKALLIEVLDKVREQSKISNNPILQARCNAQWELIDMLLLFLNKKETDMQKLKSDLIRHVISLAELPPKHKHSELEERIKEAVDALSQLMGQDRTLEREGAMIPVALVKEGINPTHLAAKIAQMRNDEKIGRDITTKKSGENYYLVKLPKGQTVIPKTQKR